MFAFIECESSDINKPKVVPFGTSKQQLILHLLLILTLVFLVHLQQLAFRIYLAHPVQALLDMFTLAQDKYCL
jgi:hypothetical protein